MSDRPRVLVLGGGFGGLSAVRALRRAAVDVTLLDRRNHHLFQPLLYQVATAALNPSDIAQPIRGILRRQKNVTVLLGEATSVDTARRTVTTPDGDIAYDFLIVATGATHSYFGHEEWAERAKGLKTVEDALEIRRRVFLAYEAAERETGEARRRALLTYVIVGAGATGVEMAGALAEISRHALRDDFRRIDPRSARIVLVEGAERVLPGYPEDLSAKARVYLERLGVEVRTRTLVTAVDARGVELGEERLEAATVVWAAGVEASSLARSFGVPLHRSGRVPVQPDLKLAGRDDVFVIGDLMFLEQDGAALTGVAQVAMQSGRAAARNIARSIAGVPSQPFRYRDPGSFATIGRGSAVGILAGLKVSGFVAWLLWLLIHIAQLIGFRNRFAVLSNWAYSYFTWRRGAQLITGGPDATRR